MDCTIKHIKPKLSTTYNPENYNRTGIVAQTNCYAYALDEPGLGFPWIGHLRYRAYARQENIDYKECVVSNTVWRRQRLGNLTSEWDKANALLHVDGLERISTPAIDKAEQPHIVAFIPFFHNHFYRLDKNGVWSHKPSMLDVRNTDIEGEILTDLEKQVVERIISKLEGQWASDVGGRPELEEEISIFESGKGIGYFRIPQQGIHVYIDNNLEERAKEFVPG